MKFRTRDLAPAPLELGAPLPRPAPSASPARASVDRRRACRRTATPALVAFLLACAPAWAEASPAPYVWRSVKVGGGGYIPAVVFSPVERGLAYARSDMGGAYRWDRRAARWIPLEDGLAEGSWQGVESLAPDPVNPDVVYAAVGVGARAPSAMLRSHDRGDHWEVVRVPFRMGGNEDGLGLGEILAVDPDDTRVLYFGSRHDGLQRSTDAGRTWSKVASFPLPGLGPPGTAQHRMTHAGLGFVVFDPANGRRGAPTPTLFVGSADPGGEHLFRSNDAGRTWRAVTGGPATDLLPIHGALDGRGHLFITYSDAMGPSGITRGAVWRLDTRFGTWTDVTPDKRPDRPAGGYLGLALDRAQPGVVMVATGDRFHPGDEIWRSRDGGETWKPVSPHSRRDVSATPFLLWGEPQADFGWWMSALAIDPFDPEHVVYATGATVYATNDVSAVDTGGVALWRPWTEGIEQTAVITLASPAAGPPLLSGFGDISGFVHERLDLSPVGQFTRPVFGNTDAIAVAGAAPNVVVRTGTAHGAPHGMTGATLAWSQDYGRSWSSLQPPEPVGDAAGLVSADGRTLVVATSTPMVSRDRGETWSTVGGLPARARPVADPQDPRRFYALDFATGRMFVSRDGAASFAPLPARGLPPLSAADSPASREVAWPLIAAPGRSGDLWLVSTAGLFHSVDGGATFASVPGGLAVQALAFGKAPAGRDYPALFAIGVREGTRAIWRSDDRGASWLRVNDDAHEYGRKYRCLAGDPRVFGRVYVGTDGRGILHGEPGREAPTSR